MTDYYVDPANGSNSNSGTSETDALQNFSELAPGGKIDLQPGDTVFVTPSGTISENSNSGDDGVLYLYGAGSNSGEKITVQSANDSKVQLDGSGSTREGVKIRQCENVHVRDLYVSDAEEEGFMVDESNNITLEHCVGDTCGRDLSLASPNTFKIGGNNCLIRNCRSENNQHENGDGFSCESGGGGNRYEHCVSLYDRDGGFDTYGAASDNPNTFYKCIAAHSGVTREGVTEDETGTGNGPGFKAGSSSGSGGNQRFIKCVAYKCTEGNQAHGFTANNEHYGSEYINCVAYGCGEEGFGLHSENDSEDTVKNCIAINNGGGPIETDGSEDISDNSWDLGIDDPQFVSTNLEDDGFMKLQDGSPCIDAGTDVGLEYSGNAPDLGALEKGLNENIGIIDSSNDGSSDGGSGDSGTTEAVLKYWDGSSWQSFSSLEIYVNAV